jgi:hypothetical protein
MTGSGVRGGLGVRDGSQAERLAALAAGDGGFGFVVGFSLALGGAFIPLLFALGKGDLAFDPAVAEVEAGGNQGEAFLAGSDFEFAHLGFVQQKFAGAQRLVVHGIAVGKRADVGVEQEALSVLEQAVGVLEVGLAFANRLNFGAAEGDAGFVFVEEGVVIAGGAIVGRVAHSGGDRVTVFLLDRRFRLGGYGRIGERAGHGWAEAFCFWSLWLRLR